MGYANGRGVEKNLPESLRLYRMASELRRAQSLDDDRGKQVNAKEVTIQLQGSNASSADEKCLPPDDRCKDMLRLFTTKAVELAVMAMSCQCRSRKAATRRRKRGH